MKNSDDQPPNMTFKPHGFSGLPNTCHWCGDPLTQETFVPVWWADSDLDELVRQPYPNLGYQGDGCFCTQHCGYQFARHSLNGK